MWPKLPFDIFESGFFAVKSRVVQNGLGHRKSPMARTLH
jgi:hypothetical protein